ncbi:hypothetical protein LV780_19525 (plasmid) [Cereibacter azotoformans]|uniref:hypothetical protein n=1 Tax=Cereibacter azotoformans TaxID=43057 RepID=UPI000E358A34|nr:hypothetical protein [Cereibacter azotoformans]AXQ95963.1 hypothetical protein D0Z66_19585 [Cereibacter sphaeroides]UIJ33032.1 hypothetical protein LV780_19525 [Cereibacter azotoformans]
MDRIGIVQSTFGGYLSDNFNYSTDQLNTASFITIASASEGYSKPYNETFIFRADTRTLYFDQDSAGSTYGEIALFTQSGSATLVASDIFGL